jgi:hypothetical protein
VPQALAAEEAAAAAEQQRLADETARRLQIQAAKSALVSPEVAPDSPEPHTTLLFRLPDGTKFSRRFRLVQTVQELFDYLDSEVGGEGGMGADRVWEGPLAWWVTGRKGCRVGGGCNAAMRQAARW